MQRVLPRREGVAKIDGVISASVNLTTEKASVEYDPAQVDEAALAQAIEKTGYLVAQDNARAELAVEGMTCAACSNRVERALNSAPGVRSAVVNLTTGRASVEYNPAVTDLDSLLAAIDKAGYLGRLAQEEDSEDEDDAKLRLAARRMWTAWAFTIPAAIWMLIAMTRGGHQHGWPSTLSYNLGMVLLALPVLFWAGGHVQICLARSATAVPIWTL